MSGITEGPDFTIARLGECRVPSPMVGARFVPDNDRVLYHSKFDDLEAWLEKGAAPPSMEAAGPREKLFFDPATLACGIVTCGGLCPGLNDVVRAIVHVVSAAASGTLRQQGGQEYDDAALVCFADHFAQSVEDDGHAFFVTCVQRVDAFL